MKIKSICNFFKSSLKKILSVALCLTLLSGALQADDMGNSWAIVATRDLQFARKVLLDSHPAALLEDEGFHAWMRNGFEESLKLARQARNEEQAFASVRYFLSGFKDGHLGVVPSNDSDDSYWTGWTVRESEGLFYVWDVADAWNGELPPLGAVLKSCDGSSVNEVVEQIAPFIDRRSELPGTLIRISTLISNRLAFFPLWKPLHFKECTFQLSTGEFRSYAVTWKKTPYEDGWVRAFKQVSAPRFSMEEIESGTYWAYVSSFQIKKPDLETYDGLLEKIRRLENAKTVVFDVRANDGGNSLYGEKILRALLKEKMTTSHSKATAFWRVSDLSMRSLEDSVLELKNTDGPNGGAYKFVNSLYEHMKDSSSRGELWMKQQEDSEGNFEEDKGIPFSGKIVVVTNEFCASACLDFVDIVLQLPNAIHLGRTTSADTDYLDIAKVQLPSGVAMWLPLKVWRNRLRKSNQPHIPVQRFPGDMRDTASLQQWVLKSVAETIPVNK